MLVNRQRKSPATNRIRHSSVVPSESNAGTSPCDEAGCFERESGLSRCAGIACRRQLSQARSTLFGHLMELDDEVCLCFHVSKRKLLSYMRINKARMRRASQLSDCGGAGTGCGWCVGYLKRLFVQTNPEAAEAEAAHIAEPTPEEHRSGRAVYLKRKEEG